MTKQTYSEVVTLRDQTLFVPITYRETEYGARFFSFAFMREYIVEGVRRTTPWLNRRHIKVIRRMLDKVEEKLLAAEKE